jgi:ribosomal protein L7/L12
LLEVTTLDNNKFAQLISYISILAQKTLNGPNVSYIEKLVEQTNPPQPTASAGFNPGIAGGVSATLTTGETCQLNAIIENLNRGHRIEAIKEYRSLTGMGIKESKDAIERGRW